MKAKGFTLLEVLLVVAVIAILMALSFAGLQRVRMAGDRAGCVSNLRSIGTAVLAYSADHDGYLPPGNRKNMGGVFHRILAPYTAPMKATTISADLFYCPANVRLGAPPEEGYPGGAGYKGWSGYFFGYMLNASIFKVTNPDSDSSTYVPDGEARIRLHSIQVPSKTVALMDLSSNRSASSGPPLSKLPSASYFNPKHASFSLGLVHGGRGNVLFVDGHVETFDGKSVMRVISLPERSETW